MNSEETREIVQAVRGMPALPGSGSFALAAMSDQEFEARLALLERSRRRVERIFLKIMKPGVDYGVIAGTGDKPTLLQPGAETLLNAVGYVATFPREYTIREVGDGVTAPQIHYQVLCVIHAGDVTGPVVGCGGGTSNSWEKKNRYREGSRTCPDCGQIGTVIKGKEEYGGGWLCFKKKGGCNAKFPDEDPRIASQQVGQVENADPYDLDNTLYKMAAKRGMIDATKRATGTSHLFTQDMEDLAEILRASGNPPLESTRGPTRQAETQGQVGSKRERGSSAAGSGHSNGTGQKSDAVPSDPVAIVAWFKARVAAMQPLSWPAETVAKNAQSLAMALKRSGFSDDARHRLYQTLTGKTNGGDLDPRELLVLLNSIQDAPQLLKLAEGTAGGSGEAAPTSSPSTPNPPAPEPASESGSEPLGVAMPESLMAPLKAATRQYIWGAAPSPLSTDPKRRGLGWKAARDRLKLNRIDGAKADAIFAILRLVETGETLGPEEIGKRLNGHWLSAIQDCPESLIETLGEAADWWLSRRKGE